LMSIRLELIGPAEVQLSLNPFMKATKKKKGKGKKK
jgi:hypothetical protein